ncbi:unnamed protein product, partial [Linum tenue]
MHYNDKKQRVKSPKNTHIETQRNKNINHNNRERNRRFRKKKRIIIDSNPIHVVGVNRFSQSKSERHGHPPANQNPHRRLNNRSFPQHGSNPTEHHQRQAHRAKHHSDPHLILLDESGRQQRHHRPHRERQPRRRRRLHGVRQPLLSLSLSPSAAAASLLVPLHLGHLDVVLRVDRDELADGHAAGPSHQAREPGQDHGLHVLPHRPHAHHQGGRGDQPVVGSQHRGSEPLSPLGVIELLVFLLLPPLLYLDGEYGRRLELVVVGGHFWGEG